MAVYASHKDMIRMQARLWKPNERTILRIINENLPASSLPAELLVKILLHNVVKQGDQWTRKQAKKRIIYASHVCQHWRAITILTPLLWIDIDITMFPLELTNLMLERCQGQAIELRYPEYYDKGVVGLDFKNTPVDRLRSFRGHISKLRSWETFAKALRNPQGKLEVLHVWRDRHAQPKYSLPAIIPSVKSKNPTHSSRLKEISLFHCYTDLTLPVFSNVQVLELSGFQGLCEISSSHLLAVLRNLPLLRELVTCLASIVPPYRENHLSTQDRPPPVHLPNLRKIDMWEDIGVVHDVIGHLDVPQSCATRFVFTDAEPTTISAVETLGAIMVRKIQHGRLSDACHSLVFQLSECYFTLGNREYSTGSMISFDPDLDAYCHLRLTDFDASYNDRCREFITRTLSALEASIVGTLDLTLDFYAQFPFDLLYPHLCKFSNVKTLSMGDISTISLLLPILSLSIRERSTILFPSLSKIVFDPRYATDQDQEGTHLLSGAGELEAWIDYLSFRRMNGMGIKTVEFRFTLGSFHYMEYVAPRFELLRQVGVSIVVKKVFDHTKNSAR